MQWHLPSDRLNLYLPSHVRTIEGLAPEDSQAKLAFLRAHVTQDRYKLSIPWLQAGDLVMWDNTCTLHRATDLKRPCRRDMRRCGVSCDLPFFFVFFFCLFYSFPLPSPTPPVVFLTMSCT